MTIFSALLLVDFFFGRSLVAVVDAQLGNESTRISLGSVACAELNGARLTAVTCNNNFDAAASFPPTGTSLGMGTAASGFATFASGLLSQATGDVATAIGFNVTAGGNSSVAFGVDTRTVSDDGAYADGTCGGCFVTGKLSTAVGDWCVATGYNTLARGYASSAFGEGTVASSWGEVALGLYNEIDFGRTEAQLGSASVIPTFNESDVALRVGIGCDPNPMYGGIGCPERRRLDALRVYKSGRLCLKKLDGSVLPDVQSAIESLQAENALMRQQLDVLQQEIDSLKSTSSSDAVISSSSTVSRIRIAIETTLMISLTYFSVP